MKLKNISVLIFLLFFILFTACKKKKTIEDPAVPTGTIGFHMHIMINEEEVDSGAVFTNTINSEQIKLNVVKFYLSNITAYKTDGTAVPVKDKIILVHMGEEEYVIGDVPTGNYQSLSFQVGLDPAANKLDPSTQTGALSSSNNMWFGSTAKGYVFINVSGAIDTSANHSGKVDKAFAYQFGSDAYLKTIAMRPLTEIGLSPVAVTPLNTPGLPAQFHVLCDFGILLQNIKSKIQNPVATPFNSDSTYVKSLLNNVGSIFRYEQ